MAAHAQELKGKGVEFEQIKAQHEEQKRMNGKCVEDMRTLEVEVQGLRDSIAKKDGELSGCENPFLRYKKQMSPC